MKNVIFLTIVFVVASLYPHDAKAAETMIFDSTNNYLGACQLTDKSEWEITKDLNVSTFQIWYNWDQNETTLPVIVYQNGTELFAKFEAKRSACDPYQKQWCNADYQINKVFPKGKYTTEIPTKKQCLKPGSTGTVRLYEDSGSSTSTVTTSPTTVPTINTVSTLPVTTTQGPKTATIIGCSCTQTIVITATAASILSSLLTFVLTRKRR